MNPELEASAANFINQITDLIGTVALPALIVYGVIFLVVFVGAVSLFVHNFRSMRKFDREFDRKWRK